MAKNRLSFILYVFLMLWVGVDRLQARDFPAKTVEITIPFAEQHAAAAGLRVFADFLSKKWQQEVKIIYQPKNKRFRFWQEVDSFTDDGYSYGQKHIPEYLVHSILGKANYNPEKQQAVFLYQCEPRALFIRKNSRIQDIAALREFLKRQGSGVEIAGKGVVSIDHITHLRFMVRADLEIPYRSFDSKEDAYQAVRDEEVIAYWGSIREELDGGIAGLRILALASEVRHPQFPYVPLFRESTIDLQSADCSGLLLPETADQKFAKDFSRTAGDIYKSAAYRQQVYKLGLEPYFIDYKKVQRHLRTEQKSLEKLLEKFSLIEE